MSDKYFANVVLLCGFNGADGATAFTDESSAARTATFVGNAQLDTAQAKFGSASLLLDGTGDYVTFPNSADLQIAGQDFTIEAWVRIAATGRVHTITNKRDGSGAEEHSFSIDTSNHFSFSAYSSGAPIATMTGTTALATGAWYHAAASRSGSNWYLHVGGVLESTATSASAASTNTGVFHVGRDGFNTARDFQGWIDEVRFTKGISRYGAANFLPPRGPFNRRKNLGVLGESSQPILIAA